MGIFSTIFGSPDERKIKCIIREAEEEVTRTTKPLGDIGIAITKASYACSQDMKPMLNIAIILANNFA